MDFDNGGWKAELRLVEVDHEVPRRPRSIERKSLKFPKKHFLARVEIPDTAIVWSLISDGESHPAVGILHMQPPNQTSNQLSGGHRGRVFAVATCTIRV